MMMMTMKRHMLLRAGIPAVLAAWLAGCFGSSAPSTDDLAAVGEFDPKRYCGLWYEAARLPHSFERGMTDVSAHYTLRPDGKIAVVNRGIRDGEAREAHGVARTVRGKEGTGELEVSFFRPFYGKYRIIRLAPDYSTAMVTSGDRSYLWILTRARHPDPALLAEWVRSAGALGFEVSKLEYPNAHPSPAERQRR